MAQHDYVLDNQSGAEFRADLNNALSAIVSQNSGAFEPSTTYAYMLWADTTSNQLKQRNAANTDWVVLQELDGTLLMESGTASDPGLAFASDKNTGFYRAGADKLGISTGGSSRIVVDDQGQVLFGTTTGSWSSRAVFFGDTTFGTGGATVTLAYGSANPTDDTVVGDIHFNDSSAGSPGAIIRATADANWGTYQPTRIEFWVSSASAGAGEVMRIDSEGRLGLGTSAPPSIFSIEGTDPLITFRNSATNRWQLGYENTNSHRFVLYDTNAAAYRAVIDSSGNAGIGTTSPDQALSVQGLISTKAPNGATRGLIGSPSWDTSYFAVQNGILAQSAANAALHQNTAGVTTLNSASGQPVLFTVGQGERLRITSDGKLGLGTSSPSRLFHVSGTTDTPAQFQTSQSNLYIQLANSSASNGYIGFEGTNLSLWNNGANRLNIASSGNVGIGTTSPGYALDIQAADTTPGLGYAMRLRENTTAGAATIQFTDSAVTAQRATLTVDSSSNIYIANSSERVRIDSSGRLLVGTSTSPGNGNEKLGISSGADGIWIDVTGAGGTGIVIDRTTADGDLINFLQAGTQEGAISVSGTTVTYGGGHLARWSQLPNNEDPSSIFKGTVMSNLDEMCKWGEEDNEQLNRTKVSEVEGDPNVAGVFVSTSFSDDGPLDFFVGMTGDMIIRIAEGVTVQRGDLLMSAGDGTAKPQDDDIIRSKTVAKVTSTHVTCTYDDGSYCVPCVLMAC
jgi:hypothetical protein